MAGTQRAERRQTLRTSGSCPIVTWPPWAAFGACSLIWGSTWLAIKVGYEGLAPLWGASLRFGLATLVLVAVARAWRRPLRLRGTELRVGIFVGVVLFTLDYGLIYWGEQFISSGLTAVLFASMPFFTGLFAHAFLRGERFTTRKALGVLLGVVGLGAIFRESLAVGPELLLPMLAVVGAALCAAAANVASKGWGHGIHPVALSANAMGVGSACLLLAAVVNGDAIALPSTAVAWASVLFLALLGSVVAFLLMYWLLKRWEAFRISLIVVLTPVVALALGVAVRKEAFGIVELAGTAFVLAGVYVNVGGAAAEASAPPAPEAVAVK